MRIWLAFLFVAICPTLAFAQATSFRDDAFALEGLINRQYAYSERLPGQRVVLTPKLRAEAEAVASRRDLIRFAERALLLLADHHAITGASLSDSWAVFPSYGDLWVEHRGGQYLIEQVREDSPAAKAGVRAGDRLVAAGGVPVAQAVASFWSEIGTMGGGERDAFAARVLAAGRRDRPRVLTFQRGSTKPFQLHLPNLYGSEKDRPALFAHQEGRSLVIRFNDSLGSDETIPAFDRIMASARSGQPVVLDLTDTPSGGNSSVARGIMGWFVSKPTAYQVHSLPVEEQETGIARQWVEQVLPRRGKFHAGPVTVRVGRWTGSMGEGLAIGFNTIGAQVVGTRMAGLLGAIYDHPLGSSGLIVKLPTERLCAVDGTARERFVPATSGSETQRGAAATRFAC